MGIHLITYDGRVGRWEIDERHEIARVQAFSPSSADSTHVFWWLAHNFATDRELVGDHLDRVFAGHAEEHHSVLEAAQDYAQQHPGGGEVNVKADAAALKARRIVQVMVEGERGSAPLRPGLNRHASR